MDFSRLQPYIFPLIIIAYVGYRLYRFRLLRKKLPDLLDDGAILVDVRSASEFSSGHNPKSRNIPLDQLENESSKLDKNKTIVLCCASGTRSGMAAGILKRNGFTKVINAGPWGNTIL